MGVLKAEGVAKETVLEELTGYTGNDIDVSTGRVLTGLYDPGKEVHDLAVEAYTRFLSQNALYVNMYPSLGKLEKDIIDSVADLLRGDDNVTGNITSGGTESILMAVKTARDWARENRPHITEPEMVLPVTAHPAFLKAAHYFGVRAVQTPVETDGFRADVDAFREALGPNVIIAVGSAPNFSHGTIDPIEEMAELAGEKDILFHVDGCVGGIYLSVMRRMGEEVRDFDFSVPGVTSISADLHKYGYAPKNASVILYHSRELRKYAWFVCTTTTEYVVINPTVQSTRTGGPIAGAWATMRFLGEEGFRNIVRDSQKATRQIIDGIADIEGITVPADPEMCMFTIISDEFNVFEIDDEMRERGWQMVPQFSCGGGPENLHVSMTKANIPHTQAFLKDLREVVDSLRKNGSGVDSEKLQGVVKDVEDKPLEEVMMVLIEHAGMEGTELPKRMATLNTILNFIPAERRDELLTIFFNMI